MTAARTRATVPRYACVPFGVTSDGQRVDAITLTSPSGIRAKILTLGAAVQGMWAPDRDRHFEDIVLGFDDVEQYSSNPAYLGVTLGRYANRIAGGRFLLDGRPHALVKNDRTNTLHGGLVGFGRKLWTIDPRNGGRRTGVRLVYDSPDGEDGFPGALTITAHFELHDQCLIVSYRATTNAPTIVNISNHTYFNLSGAASCDGILGHQLTIPAETFLPVDDTQIPTGEFRSVAGTPFDFRSPTTIGLNVRNGRDEQLLIAKGYDHNWVLRPARGGAVRCAARLHEPTSGRTLEVYSSQPGLQFYSGNSLDGSLNGKSGRIYRQSDGLALEPQLFPDTPNQPAFGSAQLNPGETYSSCIIYRMIATERGAANADVTPLVFGAN